MSRQYYECPKCGCEDFNCSTMETDDNYAWRIVNCKKCNFEWQEVYQFNHNEDFELNILNDIGEPE